MIICQFGTKKIFCTVRNTNSPPCRFWILPKNNNQILEGYWIPEQHRDPCWEWAWLQRNCHFFTIALMLFLTSLHLHHISLHYQIIINKSGRSLVKKVNLFCTQTSIKMFEKWNESEISELDFASRTTEHLSLYYCSAHHRQLLPQIQYTRT